MLLNCHFHFWINRHIQSTTLHILSSTNHSLQPSHPNDSPISLTHLNIHYRVTHAPPWLTHLYQWIPPPTKTTTTTTSSTNPPQNPELLPQHSTSKISIPDSGASISPSKKSTTFSPFSFSSSSSSSSSQSPISAATSPPHSPPTPSPIE